MNSFVMKKKKRLISYEKNESNHILVYYTG